MPTLPIEVKLDTSELDDFVRRNDDLLANNVFVNMGRSMGKFRKEWLRAVRETVGVRVARQFFFVRSSDLSGKYKADRIKGEFFTTSNVALGLEEGGVQRAKGGGRLAIPVGHALSSGSRAYVKKAYKDPSNKMSDLIARKALIVKRSQKPGVLLAYEIINPTSTRRKRTEDGKSSGYQKARLIYVLTQTPVRRKPVLHFFDSWREYEPLHVRRMEQSIEATLRGIYLK